jgi:hypothetical protein
MRHDTRNKIHEREGLSPIHCPGDEYASRFFIPERVVFREKMIDD